MSFGLLIAALAGVAIMLWRGVRPQAIDGMWLLVPTWLAFFVMPREDSIWRRLGIGLCVATWAAAGVLVIYKFRDMPAGDRNHLVGHAIPFGFYFIAFLVALAAFEAWKKLRSPMSKAVTATAAITAGAVFGLFAVVWLLRPVVENWHYVHVENWSTTLLVVYLPLMALAWFGYDRWRKRKEKSGP